MGRLVGFDKLACQTQEELVEELAERRVTYVIYTYREPPQEGYARDQYYYRKFKMHLVDRFKDGRALPHFRHVTTLELPERVGKLPVQVYRFIPGEGDAGSSNRSEP